MLKNDFFYSQGTRVPLTKAKNVIAVKESAENEHTGRTEFMTTDRKAILVIPQYGIGIYEDGASRRNFTADNTVSDELPIFEQTAGDYMIATREFHTKFKPEVTESQINEMNQQFGVKIVEKLPYDDHLYRLEIIPGENKLGVVETANAYYESGETIESEPNFIRKKHVRDTTSNVILAEQANVTERSGSDYLPEQWHLVHTKVIDAWENAKGTGVTICIMDDGVETSHPEFQNRIVKQRDYSDPNLPNDGNPNLASDNHGTSVAGVAAAAGVKAYGAAPASQIIAIRSPDYLGVDAEAKMFDWAVSEGADVINCSWGPPDTSNPNTDWEYPLPLLVRAAIHNAATRGRNGKGVIICWAAGNGNQSMSTDQYAANPDVLAIAACTDSGERSSYSDFGNEVWISAPSNGGRRGILTTDRSGNKGYNQGTSSNDLQDSNYTGRFGGTSSASPLVAGIVGLMLSANSALTLQDVKGILARTADKIGDPVSYARETALGRHSDLYGYGRVNALNAVKEAKRLGSGI
ncbi:S8 family serine peptidase [Paenibacillus silvae]|uniref:S8 family serine peptidase n=1 Tax=Paenibacillus silvae TaxID=1325358 RepID=UPI003CF60939